MTSKTKMVAAYGFALLLSHLWLSFQTPEAENLEQRIVAGTDGTLFVLCGKAGGFGNEFREFIDSIGDGSSDQILETTVTHPQFGEKPSENLPRSIHIVGSGYGCVDALFLAERWGSRVSSVTLLSPVVSTRFELLGDGRLNRALKAFQLAWFWVLENAVPHFGATRYLPYNLETAVRVYEADFEAASRVFAELDTPLLIAYGESGRFSSSGALEAFRLVRPSAVLMAYPGNDDDVLARHAEELRKAIVELTFFNRVGSDKPTEPLRFEDMAGIKLGPWWAGFLLAIATFASEDFACIGGGLLAAGGAVDLSPVVLGCILGIFLGDLGVYFIGRIFGVAALEIPGIRRLVSSKALGKSSEWFEKRGLALVILTRFLPGSRVPTYFAAGVVKVGWIRFALALLLASAIWTPILVLASYHLGDAFLDFFESLGAGGWLGIVVFVVCFVVGMRTVVGLSTWKGRRLMYSKWRRWTSWEFWPMWAVYAPVAFQIAWLSIRYRSLSLPFSVNPCMPASGLVYESKGQILKHLERSGVPVARFEEIELKLPIKEKLYRLEAFIRRLGLSYPVVLKPDVGQRGQGVVIAKSEADAAAFFAKQEESTIAQEYIGGSEYGVFYHRFANIEEGEVSSITDKRTTSVVGDGTSSLETLILRDERAVCMAPYFLREFEAELDRVLAVGERFMLATIGTHSRGAVFLDGGKLLTPELKAAVDSFSKRVEGFHFGRYDLRVPNAEHLKRGQGIRVIELNGITSEPTNMYDPSHGPLFGWRSLMRQWRLIFALAKENRLAGHEPVSVKYVLSLGIAHFRGDPSRDLP